MDAERKDKTAEAARFTPEQREHVDEEMNAQMDSTNLEAVKEAARLGGGDAFIVASDLEDKEEREDGDQPDGRPSPMANADNQER